MSHQQDIPVLESPTFRSILILAQTWLSLFAGITCLSVYGSCPLHPKSGDDAIMAIVGFSIAAGVGIGMSLAGVRKSNGFTKVVAYTAFAMFSIVALDLANNLIHG